MHTVSDVKDSGKAIGFFKLLLHNVCLIFCEHDRSLLHVRQSGMCMLYCRGDAGNSQC